MAVSPTAARAEPGRPPSPPGFTLVEAAVSVLIVGVMLTASLYAIGGVAKARCVRAGRQDALALAQDLMSEILPAYYRDPTDPTGAYGPGTEPGEQEETRADFDDVDDYSNWCASPPQAKDGTPLAGYDGWVRSVSVAPCWLVESQYVLREIVVTVVDPRGGQTQLRAVRSAFVGPTGSLDEQTSHVARVGVELKVGANGDPALSGVGLVNEPLGE